MIQWNAIRAFNGSQDQGFEELCAQLARTVTSPGSSFVRKGTPDAGVECYVVHRDGTEWGWQAKYFFTMGPSQWSQLDESVKTALDKHPRLTRYVVCIPIDLPDGRIKGRKSAKDRWDERVQKWAKWASQRGMTVVFVYWGSSELLEQLTLPEHIGRVHYWFDTRRFSRAWFMERLEEAVHAAGPRYTPEIHVDLPVAQEFEAFGRTEAFFDHIKSLAKGIRKSLRQAGYSWSTDLKDEQFAALVSPVTANAERILKALSEIRASAIDPLTFGAIAEQIDHAQNLAKPLLTYLHDRELNRSEEAQVSERRSVDDKYRDQQYKLRSLIWELEDLGHKLLSAHSIATSTLLLLRGNAGTGKTHLLCDLANKRISEGRPTILLMGQQFISDDMPWVQAIQQLDMPDFPAAQFVGALEAAAQSVGCRALVLVDAINEGNGKEIWPNNLASFLVHLERSPWIGVVISVRSTYEELVVPDEIRKRAFCITHHGFEDNEYDAVKTFFNYYGIELPSSPLLAPEFSNPLFLKTLCRGLSESGVSQIPRGLYGITSVFNLFLDAINTRLSRSLNYNVNLALVKRAIESFASALVASGNRWLSLEHADHIVNSLLPGRDFDRSLYHGLVSEGVLTEDVVSIRDGHRSQAVLIGYERFADHVIVELLLDKNLNVNDPAAAFAPGGVLDSVCNNTNYGADGLIEALCIQVPERIRKELVEVAPQFVGRWGIRDAFRQSLIWRSKDAFSDNTRKIFNEFTQNNIELLDSIDVLLTVATLANHPFNADFLHQRLLDDPMPDRDSWWSTSIHYLWDRTGALQRLIDWAWSVEQKATVESESARLCAITLAWTLSSSNRFLRDRSTAALVTLLTGRFDILESLVDLFSTCDDPYIQERIYAVSYGVAMRCHDAESVGRLSMSIYNKTFATNAPPPHILLRDYARGIVERAVYLGAKLDVKLKNVRPPYSSKFPVIPSEEEIEPLKPCWERGSHDSGDLEWSRNRIGSSVLNDDFGRYVIGTNSSSLSHHWLSVGIDEPIWKSPEERLSEIISELSVDAREAVEAYEGACRDVMFEISMLRMQSFAAATDSKDAPNDRSASIVSQRLSELEKSNESPLEILKELISAERGELIIELIHKKLFTMRDEPGFPLDAIQRYVLWRVFDLGWTVERFGEFDRYGAGERGRSPRKAERMGKKYQWIAYHEMLAYLSDNFQYRVRYADRGNRIYEGPWQCGLRDIDPSCTLRNTKGGTSWGGHTPGWWCAHICDNWVEPESHEDWVARVDDIPDIASILQVTHPEDKTTWINVKGFFDWMQPTPPDFESSDVEQRELMFGCTGYLIKSEEMEKFIEWAGKKNLWERRMPEPPQVGEMFLGEHGWSQASKYFQRSYYGDDGWVKPSHSCPAAIRTIAFIYTRSGGDFDCAVDDSYHLQLPTADLMNILDLKWGGIAANYNDVSGRVAILDPTANSVGPSSLLLRADLVYALADNGLSICWVVTGEKRVVGQEMSNKRHSALRFSGVYRIKDEKLEGSLNFNLIT